MLNFTFNVMDFEKVGFRTDERNIQSHNEVEKLGGVPERMPYRNVYRWDGFKRNTFCPDLLKEDWKSGAKDRLFFHYFFCLFIFILVIQNLTGPIRILGSYDFLYPITTIVFVKLIDIFLDGYQFS